MATTIDGGMRTRGVASSRTQQATRKGKHGTLRLYRLVYVDATDPGCPDFTNLVWRYNARHAMDAFDESCDGENDWRLLRVEPIDATWFAEHC